MVHHNQRILRMAARKHAISGSLANFMIIIVVFFLLADIDLSIGWLGLDSLAIMAVYVIAIRLLHTQNRGAPSEHEEDIPDGVPSLKVGLIGFSIAAAALVVATPVMVTSSAEIAELTGLGTTFIGTVLVALVTSLPELVTTVAAVKLGADDMAIGNLFGSNLFNMFAFGLSDVFFTGGRFIGIIDPSFAVIGMLGLIMTCLGLIGNLARLERRILFLELDALALILVYFGGMWMLFARGLT
jgi:cation:H+ antiporter